MLSRTYLAAKHAAPRLARPGIRCLHTLHQQVQSKLGSTGVAKVSRTDMLKFAKVCPTRFSKCVEGALKTPPSAHTHIERVITPTLNRAIIQQVQAFFLHQSGTSKMTPIIDPRMPPYANQMDADTLAVFSSLAAGFLRFLPQSHDYRVAGELMRYPQISGAPSQYDVQPHSHGSELLVLHPLEGAGYVDVLDPEGAVVETIGNDEFGLCDETTGLTHAVRGMSEGRTSFSMFFMK